LPTAIVYGVLLKRIDVAGLSPSEVGILSGWRKKLSTAGDFGDLDIGWYVEPTLSKRLELRCRLAFDKWK